MKNNELETAYNLIHTMPCIGMSMTKLRKTRELVLELKSRSDEYKELRKKILESYGIGEGEEDKFFNHTDFKKISEEVRAYDEDLVPAFEKGNFLTEPEMMKCVTQYFAITTLGIEMMESLLVKPEEVKVEEESKTPE